MNKIFILALIMVVNSSFANELTHKLSAEGVTVYDKLNKTKKEISLSKNRSSTEALRELNTRLEKYCGTDIMVSIDPGVVCTEISAGQKTFVSINIITEQIELHQREVFKAKCVKSFLCRSPK